MTAPHFLVPVDFSPYSEQALAYAIALATKLQACVTVVHVIDHLPMAERYAAVSPRPDRVSAYLQELEAKVQQRLDAQTDSGGWAGRKGPDDAWRPVSDHRGYCPRQARGSHCDGHAWAHRCASPADGQCGREGDAPGPVPGVGHASSARHRCLVMEGPHLFPCCESFCTGEGDAMTPSASAQSSCRPAGKSPSLLTHRGGYRDRVSRPAQSGCRRSGAL
jgi:Universal stress protein family